MSRLFLLPILFCLVCSCSEYSSPPEKPTPEDHGLEIVNPEGRSGYYRREITGQVVNKGRKTHPLVCVRAILFDREKNPIGEAFDTTHYLRPGQTWNFRARFDVSGMAFYRVEVSTSLPETYAPARDFWPVL
jgi:hypothetical protein